MIEYRVKEIGSLLNFFRFLRINEIQYFSIHTMGGKYGLLYAALPVEPMTIHYS